MNFEQGLIIAVVALAGAVVSLSGAVVFLFKANTKKNRDLQEELRESRDLERDANDRADTSERTVLELTKPWNKKADRRSPF